MIAFCTCVHSAQDEIHGKGRRVYNAAKPSGVSRVPTAARCTVCKREIALTKEQIKDKKAK